MIEGKEFVVHNCYIKKEIYLMINLFPFQNFNILSVNFQMNFKTNKSLKTELIR